MFRVIGYLFLSVALLVQGEEWKLSYERTDPSPATIWFNNVSVAEGVVYGLHDSQGASMDGLNVVQSNAGQWYRYYGVYHSLIANEYQVRLAASVDLLQWTFVRTLLTNADNPYIYSLGRGNQNTTGWIQLAHGQWISPGSKPPCQLGFKMYSNESEFFAGAYFATFTAPLMAGIDLMGTPNIYGAYLSGNGRQCIDSTIGFNYRNNSVDHVMIASLVCFGDAKLAPTWSMLYSEYEDSMRRFGVTGSIGQRDFKNDQYTNWMSLQAANIGSPSPTDLSAWRLWLYVYGLQDKYKEYPYGDGSWIALKPQTKGGSYSFGNPFFKALPHPTAAGKAVMLTTYYVFSEGAAKGEAGTLLFYHTIQNHK